MPADAFQPKERFTSRADEYVRFRPTYPPQVVELFDGLLRHRPHPAVADIGSGTGILTLQLLEKGYTVYGIEPNAAMRLKAEESLSRFPRFISVDAEAVRTTLPPASIDVITAAQAFHWFAEKETVYEFSRILKPGGTVLLIWNDRLTDCDVFHREYEDLLLRYCSDYARVNHRRIDEPAIKNLFHGWKCTTRHFPNSQAFDIQGLRGRVESSSYAPRKGDLNYDPLMERLERLFELHNEHGSIRMQYDCVVHALESPQPDSVE